MPGEKWDTNYTKPGGPKTKVFAISRSKDYHVYTVCGCPAILACFLCCCGLCPTKDWGQNKQTLLDLYQEVGYNHVLYNLNDL